MNVDGAVSLAETLRAPRRWCVWGCRVQSCADNAVRGRNARAFGEG